MKNTANNNKAKKNNNCSKKPDVHAGNVGATTHASNFCQCMFFLFFLKIISKILRI